METLSNSGIEYTLFFYNPNIHPLAEYEKRKAEHKRFADKLAVKFVDADYDIETWYHRTQHLALEPERGQRCTVCFDIRFERTAHYAYTHGFKLFASSMGVSRWKDMQQVNRCGEQAAKPYPNLIYWDYNWRKQGGSQRMLEITKSEQFYQQQYCGCIYSLRDTNQRRKQQGREPITMEIN